MRGVLLLLAVLSAAASAVELPIDLAYGAKKFPEVARFSVLPAGDVVAYVVEEASTAGSGVSIQQLQLQALRDSHIELTTPDRSGGLAVCKGSGIRPVWSPDGRWLAFYGLDSDTPVLQVFNRQTGSCKRLGSAAVRISFPPGDEPKWSPDSRTIFFPALESDPQGTPPQQPDSSLADVRVLRAGAERDTSGAAAAPEQPAAEASLSAIAAVDVTEGRQRILISARADPPPAALIRISPSGRWISYLSVLHIMKTGLKGSDLAVLPATGGEPRVLARELPYAGDLSVLNYSWHPSRDRLVYLLDKKLWRVEFDAQGPQPPRQLGADLGDIAYAANWYTADGSAVIVGTGPRDHNGFPGSMIHGLAIVPLDGSNPIRVDYDEAQWSYRGLVRYADQAGNVAWEPAPTTIVLQVRNRRTNEDALLRINYRSGAKQVLWQQRARLGEVSVSRQSGRIHALYEDLATPPDIYRFSSDFRRKERVSHIEPRFDSFPPARARMFTTLVPIYDGSLREVKTAVLLPPGPANRTPPPAIVLSYPEDDNTAAIDRYGGAEIAGIPTQIFTSRGYAVILPEMVLGPYGVPANILKDMTDVLLPQVYKAGSLGYVDLRRVALSGISFGGYGTLGIVTRTNLFRAAIAINGLYDLVGGSHLSWGGAQLRMGIDNDPWRDLKQFVDNSPYLQIKAISTPLLMLQGGEDFGTNDAEKMFLGLKKMDKTAQLAIYAGGGHGVGDWDRANVVDAVQRTLDFLHHHLKDEVIDRE